MQEIVCKLLQNNRDTVDLSAEIHCGSLQEGGDVDEEETAAHFRESSDEEDEEEE